MMIAKNAAQGAAKLCLTVQEAAARIGVSDRQVYNLAREAGLPTIKLMGRRLVRAADLDAWIAAQPLDRLTATAGNDQPPQQ
jgi:excisionase family DNA binding protein